MFQAENKMQAAPNLKKKHNNRSSHLLSHEYKIRTRNTKETTQIKKYSIQHK